MSVATVVEQQGLQRAIQRAIEKEDRALGRIVGNNTTITTYVACCRIGKGFKTIESQNLSAFTKAVKELQDQFPGMKIRIFEHIVKKPLSSYKL